MPKRKELIKFSSKPLPPPLSLQCSCYGTKSRLAHLHTMSLGIQYIDVKNKPKRYNDKTTRAIQLKLNFIYLYVTDLNRNVL